MADARDPRYLDLDRQVRVRRGAARLEDPEEETLLRCDDCPPEGLCQACLTEILRDVNDGTKTPELALFDWELHLFVAHLGASFLVEFDCDACARLKESYMGALAFAMLNPTVPQRGAGAGADDGGTGVRADNTERW